MGPRAGGPRAGLYDCTVALALLPCALGLLQPAALELDAQMRRHPHALVQSQEGQAASGWSALKMKDKDGDQDTIIEDLKARQEQSKQDMLALQTTMNTETMPEVSGMKKKLTGKLQPSVNKFISDLKLLKEATFMHTKNQLTTWKNDDTMGFAKNKREQQKISESYETAKETFGKGESDMESRTQRFKKDWRGYVDDQYGSSGKYTKAINKALDHITKETDARITDFKAKKAQMEDRIKFSAETQGRAMEKMESKAKTSANKVSKKVDEYLEFGTQLLKDSESLAKSFSKGDRAISKEDNAVDGEIATETANMGSEGDKWLQDATKTLEEAAEGSADQVEKLESRWQKDKARAIKETLTQRMELERNFKKSLKTHENDVGKVGKAVNSELRKQTKLAARAENDVTREAQTLDMNMAQIVASAKAMAEAHDLKEKQMKEMQAAQLRDAMRKAQEKMGLTADAAAASYTKDENGIKTLQDQAGDQVAEQGKENNAQLEHVHQELDSTEAQSEGYREQISQDEEASDKHAANLEEQMDETYEQGEREVEGTAQEIKKVAQDTEALDQTSTQQAEEELAKGEEEQNSEFQKVNQDMNDNIKISDGQASSKISDSKKETAAGLQQVADQQEAAEKATMAQTQEQDNEFKNISKNTEKADEFIKATILDQASVGREVSRTIAAQGAELDQAGSENRKTMDANVETFSDDGQNEIRSEQAAGANLVAQANAGIEGQLHNLREDTGKASKEYESTATQVAGALQEVGNVAEHTDLEIKNAQARASADLTDSKHAVQTVGLDVSNIQSATANEITSINDQAKNRLTEASAQEDARYQGMLQRSKEADNAEEARLQEAQVRMQTKLQEELGVVTAEGKTDVQKLVLGAQKLNNWAKDSEKDQKNAAANILGNIDVINAATLDLLRKHANDKEAQEKALKAHMAMMDQALEKSKGKVSADVLARLKLRAADLNNGFRTAVASAKTLTADEFNSLQELQTESNNEIMKVMSKSDQLAPQLAKYKADQEKARQDEEAWIEATEQDAESMDTERTDGLQKSMSEAKAAAMEVMESVMGALDAAEKMDERVHGALTKIATENVADIDNLAAEMAGTQTNMDADIQEAKQKARLAAKSTERDREWSVNLVGRTAAVMQSMETTVGMELEKLKSNVDSERSTAMAEATSLTDERKRLMEELHGVLTEAQGIASDVFTKRMQAIDTLDQGLQQQADTLQQQGHAQIASALRSSISFSQQYMSQLAHFKISMYEDAQLGQDTGTGLSGEKYVQLRKQLVKDSENSVRANAAFEDELQTQLRHLAQQGDAAATRLATQLKALTFDLAQGEQQGFSHLLKHLQERFGAAHKEEAALGDLLGSQLLDLARQQSRLAQIVLEVSKSVGSISTKTQSFEESLNRDLSSLRDLERTSEDELHEKIREVKRVMGRLESSFMQQSAGDKQDVQAWRSKLLNLEERAFRDRSQRKATMQEQKRMMGLLETLRELRKRGTLTVAA